jgi:hypothetical protein
MTDAAPPAPRPRRSWLLIVSLCLNIALIPVLGAVVLSALHRDVQVGTGGILAPRSLIKAFPDDSSRIQQVIAGHTPRIKQLRRGSARARLQAWQVLGAPDYTPDRMAKALEAIHAADGALEAESLAMMNDSLAVLTPAERTALVEKIRKRNRSWLFRMFRPRPN